MGGRGVCPICQDAALRGVCIPPLQDASSHPIFSPSIGVHYPIDQTKGARPPFHLHSGYSIHPISSEEQHPKHKPVSSAPFGSHNPEPDSIHPSLTHRPVPSRISSLSYTRSQHTRTKYLDEDLPLPLPVLCSNNVHAQPFLLLFFFCPGPESGGTVFPDHHPRTAARMKRRGILASQLTLDRSVSLFSF